MGLAVLEVAVAPWLSEFGVLQLCYKSIAACRESLWRWSMYELSGA